MIVIFLVYLQKITSIKLFLRKRFFQTKQILTGYRGYNWSWFASTK